MNNTSVNKLLARIKELFQERLKEKTGWGRNEIMTAYNDCVIQAVTEAIDAGDSNG